MTRWAELGSCMESTVHDEGMKEGRKEGRKEGASQLSLRLHGAWDVTEWSWRVPIDNPE